MTAESGPVSVQYPPRFSERYVVTCRKCPDFLSEHYYEIAAWEAADAHNRSHAK